MVLLDRAAVHALATAACEAQGVDPKAANTLTAIAPCESGNGGDFPCNSDATNHNRNGSTDTGVWQINSVHTRKHPTWTVSWLKVPANNATAAVTLFKESGAAPWSASSGCWVPKVSENALGSTVKDLNPLEPIAALAEPFIAFVQWVTDPTTWKRVALVVAGGGIVLVGVAVVARGTEVGRTVESAAKTAATRGVVK